MNRILRVFVVAFVAIAAVPIEGREPTELEQYYLELINRARSNPDGEVSRLSSSPDWEGPPALNEGLPAGTISSAPKQPLAFDLRIIDAASDYTDYLLSVEMGGHNTDGRTAAQRMAAAGYVFVTPSRWGENLALTGRFPSNPLNANAVEDHHHNLFVDDGVAGRGHRINILASGFREVGIAIRPDADGQSQFGSPYIDIRSSQDYAASSGRIFVTGIVYTDVDANQFFTPNNGESLGGYVMQVRDINDAVVAAGTTMATGGFAINLAGQLPQTFEFRLIDGSGDVLVKPFVWNGSTNVKVDARNPFFVPPGTEPPVIPPDGGPKLNPDADANAGKDTTPPQLTYDSPSKKARLRSRSVHRGTVTDNDRVSEVTYRISGDRTRRAKLDRGSGVWKFVARTNSGRLRQKSVVRILVTATDGSGNTTKLRQKFKKL